MAKFLVSETFNYSVEAENGLEAIAARKRGEGIAHPELTSWRATIWNQSDGVVIADSQWPQWAKEFKLNAIPEDKGIGDVVARTVGPENSEPFRTWMQKIFNKSCTGGCVARLNASYPLNETRKNA